MICFATERLVLLAVAESQDSPSKRHSTEDRKCSKNAPRSRLTAVLAGGARVPRMLLVGISCRLCWAARIVITDCLLKLLEVPKEVLQFLDRGHSQTLSIRR